MVVFGNCRKDSEKHKSQSTYFLRLENTEQQVGKQQVRHQQGANLYDFRHPKTVEQIRYIIEVFGYQEIKTTLVFGVALCVVKPPGETFLACDVVLQIVVGGETNIEKRRKSGQRHHKGQKNKCNRLKFKWLSIHISAFECCKYTFFLKNSNYRLSLIKTSKTDYECLFCGSSR